MKFNNPFSRKKTIKDLKADELKRERITLENEERGLDKKMGRLQQDDQQLLSEYAAAKQSSKQHQQKILARKIKEMRNQIKSIDQRHSYLSKQMQMVNGLILMKENQEFFDRIGASSKLNSMDITELQDFVEQAAAEGELNLQNMGAILETMDIATSSMNGADEDDMDDFMASLDDELSSSGVTSSAVADNVDLDDAMDALDREIAKTPAASEKNREQA